METSIFTEEIRKVLPHRYPFLMIDRVTLVDRENRIVKGYKNITVNEAMFQGHFPQKPVFPGVLILEAMAQLGAYYLISEPGRNTGLVYFAGMDKVKFKKVVVPGDRLDMEVRMLRDRGSFSLTQGKAYVDGELAAEAILMSAQEKN